MLLCFDASVRTRFERFRGGWRVRIRSGAVLDGWLGRVVLWATEALDGPVSRSICRSKVGKTNGEVMRSGGRLPIGWVD